MVGVNEPTGKIYLFDFYFFLFSSVQHQIGALIFLQLATDLLKKFSGIYSCHFDG